MKLSKFRAPARVVGSLLLLAPLVWASTSIAVEPAVKETNARVTAVFSVLHLDGEETLRTDGTGLAVVPESDTLAGSLSGTLTLPIDRQLAARVFVRPFFQGTNRDRVSSSRAGGLSLGGDVFLRDPDRGEISIGPRYLWSDRQVGGSFERTDHALGGTLQAKLFSEGLGFGPIDLIALANVTDFDLDREDRQERRGFGVGGSATLYLDDGFSLSAGGSWTRFNESGGEHTIVSRGDVDLALLLPFEPAVTLFVSGGGGEQEVSRTAFSTFGRTFFEFSLGVTVSFPGATSLVELNRHYY